MEAVNEAEIVSSVLAGDKEAYSVLIDLYKRPVFNLAYRLTGSIQEAEDLSQEIFLRAYSKLFRFNAQRKFFTWIYSISLNLIRNHLKKRNRAGFSIEVNENSIATGPSPERDLMESQEIALLQKCFNILPHDFREIIALKYYQGLTFLDISEVLGISESAAKMRVYRGLEKLKLLMEQEGAF